MPTAGPGVIAERSCIWQNIKVPDYMHFDTGYPSRPRQGH